MPRKRAKKTPTPNAESITKDQVDVWFRDAKIPGQEDAVSTSFAALAERWRTRNLPDHPEATTTRAEIEERIETLLSEISRLSEDLNAKIEILQKETVECGPIGRYQPIYKLKIPLKIVRLLLRPRGVGQPKALWGEVAFVFYVNLKYSLPHEIKDESIYDVVTRALAQCGWVKERKEVARQIRDLRASKTRGRG
jgi:hypothetical protein